MTARDPAQLGIATPACFQERAIDDRPASLQSALVILGKGFASEKNSRNPKRFRLEGTEVLLKQTHLVQFPRGGGDLFSQLGKSAELR